MTLFTSHGTFPESTASAPGMRVIAGREQSRNVSVHVDVEYAAPAPSPGSRPRSPTRRPGRQPAF